MTIIRQTILILSSLLVCSHLAAGQDFPYDVDTRPRRGFLPDSMTGAVDSIDPVGGYLHLEIPIVSLPPGPTGGGFELRLTYSSSIYDITPGVEGTYASAEYWQSLTSRDG